MPTTMPIFYTRLYRIVSKCLLSALLVLLTVPATADMSAQAMAPLSKKMISQAIKYGLLNEGTGLYQFLGYNWQVADDGVLINIYTPFVEISRAVARRRINMDPTPENIAKVRKQIERDIHFNWRYPKVRFIVSLFGDSPTFATEYYAVIEGVGHGKKVLLRPTKRSVDHNAQKELNATNKPYSAVNSYEFDFETVQKLDEFRFRLFTAKGEEISFDLVNRRLL